MKRAWIWMLPSLGFLLVGATVALQRPRAPAAPPPAASAPVYSPFVLEVQSRAIPFSTISFKDVGLSYSEAERDMVYESIAEGLSMELSTPSVSVNVSHDPSVVAPEHHLACEDEHVYVDLWRTQEGVGYSLWSGCGENGEFAHREVRSSENRTLFDSLTADIAGSLHQAVRTGCFSKQC